VGTVVVQYLLPSPPLLCLPDRSYHHSSLWYHTSTCRMASLASRGSAPPTRRSDTPLSECRAPLAHWAKSFPVTRGSFRRCSTATVQGQLHTGCAYDTPTQPWARTVLSSRHLHGIIPPGPDSSSACSGGHPRPHCPHTVVELWNATQLLPDEKNPCS
jgi:hypothetical protein